MKKIFYVSFMVMIVAVIDSCSKSSGGTPTTGGGGATTDCSTTSAKFGADIFPIISGSCAITGCHNGTQSPTLTSFAQIAANASLINNQVQSGAMPKTGSLTATQKKQINCWVINGALNN